MNEDIIPFRGTELNKVEADKILEFEKILEHKFLIKEEITWKQLELQKLITIAETYLYAERDKKDEVDFVWQLAISNCSVVGIGLYLNRITALPEFISEFKSLEYLVLTVGDLEIIPESIGQLESLKILNLRENQIKILPKSIGNLKSLEVLDVGRNQLKEIPNSIGNLSSLRALWIDNNQIKNLPESFENLRSLKDLHISFNDFETFPNPIKFLDSLDGLSAHGLKLKELPNWIGDLKSLKSLILTNNNLSQLPNSIGKLSQLRHFAVDNNNLTSLPESILNLNSLRIINIEGNEIKNLSAILDPLKRRGVNIATDPDQVFIDWDLTNRVNLNKILEEGNNAMLSRNFKEALKNFKMAEELTEKLSNFDHKLHYKSAILNLTGRIYLLQGNFKKSIDTAQEMLKYLELKNDIPGRAIAYNNIGNAYHGMRKNKEALKQFKIGLKLLKDQGLENSSTAFTIRTSINTLKKKSK